MRKAISLGEASYELTPDNIGMFGDLIPFHLLFHSEHVIVGGTGVTVIGEWFEESEGGIPTGYSMTLRRIHLSGFGEKEATPFAEAVSKIGNGIQVTM